VTLDVAKVVSSLQALTSVVGECGENRDAGQSHCVASKQAVLKVC
jgi:hypothetical protein